jgi:hypothetical protein
MPDRLLKTHLTIPLVNWLCPMCRRIRGKKYGSDDLNPSVVFSSTPVKGYKLPFLKGRIYG